MVALSKNQTQQQCLNFGFDGLFSKPLTTKSLFAAFNIALNTQSLESAKDNFAQSTSTDELTGIDDVEPNKSSGYFPENPRLLLVEDNTTNQVVVLGILKSFGLAADVTCDGLEALSALSSTPSDSPYQLILMDCQMPEMDGYETTKNIRSGQAGENNSEIAIIALTANAMQGDKEKCLKAGMDDYLAKPIDPESLLAKLQQWLLADANKQQLMEGQAKPLLKTAKLGK